MTSQQVFEILGIESHNSGVFAGEWLEATGDTIDVTNPTTGESLASVSLALIPLFSKHAPIKNIA